MNDAAERFAHDHPVLIGDERARPAFVAAPAESLTPGRLAQLHRLSRGMVVLALDDAGADRLALGPSTSSRRLPHALPFTNSIDAAQVTGGGWSMADRALTIRVATDPRTRACDVLTPGHVHPVRIGADDLLRQADTAAAALELARLSGKLPAAALCSVVDRRGAAVSAFTAAADTPLARLGYVSAAELRAHHLARRAAETTVECSLPTRDGAFRLAANTEGPGASTTLALVHGEPRAHRLPLVYVHYACVLGDALGSLLCDCGRRLRRAIDRILDEGAGVVIYIKPTGAVYECGRTGAVDAPTVAGLLRRTGVESVRLQHESEQLALQLGALGVAVQRRLAPAA